MKIIFSFTQTHFWIVCLDDSWAHSALSSLADRIQISQAILVEQGIVEKTEEFDLSVQWYVGFKCFAGWGLFFFQPDMKHLS